MLDVVHGPAARRRARELRAARRADAAERAEIRLDAERALPHLDQLYRYAVAITGDRHEAEDLVQEVLEALLRRPREIRGHDNEKAYLLTMLRHRYLDALRVKRRRPKLELGRLGDEQGARVGERPDVRVEQQDVLDAVARLPLHQREALVAVDVAGLSYRETAAFLGLPLGTVMSRLHRARANVVAAVAGTA
jgi:RNA polymerase sigma-70 factor (ECF subfamily)